jgi:hypothetical protein
MKCLPKIVVATFTLLFALQGLAQPAAPSSKSDKKPIAIRKLELDEVYTPNFSPSVRGDSSGNSSKLSWYKVECEFDSFPTWLDEATFTYYVECEAKKAENVESFGGNRLNTFMVRVSHVHIERGSKHLSAAYLHHKIVQRFGKVVRAAVVIEVAGQVVAMKWCTRVSVPSRLTPPVIAKLSWWKEATPIEGYLLGKEESPFKLHRIEEYEMTKPKKR